MNQRFINIVPQRLRNRYGLGIGVFLLYVCFLSDYDLYTTLKLRRQLHNMHSEHEHLAGEIMTIRQELTELNSSQALLEKFAREKYLMKRDNEDVFVIVPESN